jgi:hypothetical protein
MSIPTPAKYESGASDPSVFSWTFPGSPIRIDIPLGLISRLRAELDQHLADSTSGAEVGGVLLGRQKTPTRLEINDYVWIPSEEQPGTQYHLDPSQVKRLSQVYTFVVGYFRTQSEHNLHLRDDEITFVGKHFRDPANVVLLIHNSPELHTAGFFFWMQEGIFAPVSFLDFPLDAELLSQQVESTIDPRVTLEVEATPPVPATTGAGEEPINERLRSYLGRLLIRPLISMAVDRQLSQTESADGIPQRTVATSKTTGRISRWILVTSVVLGMLVLASLLALLFRDSSSAATRKTPATTRVSPLQLNVEANGNGLNIRWNPQSAVVTHAREGHLVILEDDRKPRTIPLDQQLLTIGHVYYRSSAERLQFQLEIVDTSGRISKESVLALSSKP